MTTFKGIDMHHTTPSSQLGIDSEIGPLRKVLLHTPGKEVELMTPDSAEELLYNDIIYYKNIVAGHEQLKSVLSLVSDVLEVSDCLATILEEPGVRSELLDEVLSLQDAAHLKAELTHLSSDELTELLITGLPLQRTSLELWLSSRSYSLVPLPNLYFMRDTSVVIGKRVVCSSMAHGVRHTEAAITRFLYQHHPALKGQGLLLNNPLHEKKKDFRIEGGDILIVNQDLLLIGVSERTSPAAVDQLVDELLAVRQSEKNKEPFNVLCVILPRERSTIHLDMIFTIVNHEQAVVYSPYVLGRQRARVVRIRVKADGDKKIQEIDDLLLGLRSVGVRMDPIPCGGDDPLHQQREQWNSGSNLFSFAPGKVISYLHEHTLHACESAGFKIVNAKDVIKHPTLIQSSSPMIVAVEGSELSRGGGGPRCMTCPILRDPI